MKGIKIDITNPTPQHKILHVKGEKGHSLTKHKVNEKALLIVSSGEIVYKEGEKNNLLKEGNSMQIPADVFHEVHCNTNASFFVVILSTSSMEFLK